MSVAIQVTSRERIYIPGIVAFGDPTIDQKTFPVEVALLTEGAVPTETDWKPAVWHSDETVRFLAGEGTTFALPVGVYAIWLRVRGAEEQPEHIVDYLEVRSG